MKKRCFVFTMLAIWLMCSSCVIDTGPSGEEKKREQDIADVKVLYDIIADKAEAKLYDELYEPMEEMIRYIGFNKDTSGKYFSAVRGGTVNSGDTALKDSISRDEWIADIRPVTNGFDIYDENGVKLGTTVTSPPSTVPEKLVGYTNYFVVTYRNDSYFNFRGAKGGTPYAGRSVLSSKVADLRYYAVSPSGFVYILFKSTNAYGYYVAVIDHSAYISTYEEWNAARQ